MYKRTRIANGMNRENDQLYVEISYLTPTFTLLFLCGDSTFITDGRKRARTSPNEK